VNKVLVIEDEPAVRDALQYALRGEGFDVDVAADGEAGLRAAQDGDYDVLVLDLMLPKMSGTEVCRRLRAESAVPIIMLTAKGAELDRVLGLEIGADDYVTKPFSMLRRRELDRSGTAKALRVGSLELDPMRHEARIDGDPKRLTPSEFKLLLMLAEQPERVFSRREIMQHLWDSDYVGDQRACDIHISNLRQKVEADPARPERIVTVRGIGYKLTAM
jgi:two-component system response regulator RegX3